MLSRKGDPLGGASLAISLGDSPGDRRMPSAPDAG
jgi:hypothetical protein